MRITNKMMTNNMMNNINKNKLNMNTLEEQYSTGKKIQKPSDDPIVTVRALKLRTNLSEIEQYTDKNIPDAKSWMDVTESSLTTVNDILSQINTYCVQGSSDTLTANDRSSIVSNLEQMKEQISQEGNTNYAGRYVFTGYKTDSSLIFTEDNDNLTYSITESFDGDQIQTTDKVLGSYEMADFDVVPEIPFEVAPTSIEVRRFQLAYDGLTAADAPTSISFSRRNASGVLEPQTEFTNIQPRSVTDTAAYEPLPGMANFIAETGELILSEEAYEEFRTAEDINITYSKTGFANGDFKPEHYFDCSVTDSDKPELAEVVYKKADQEIQYEVNYNQKLTINTEASNAITHQMGRCIDDILNAVNDVISTESKITEVEDRLKDTTLSTEDQARYAKMKEQLDTELELKKDVMQAAFATGNTTSSNEQDRVNTAVADLGSRYVRLELTENRLSSQKVDFEDLLSKNEDVDMVDTVVKYGSAEALYNASLTAASKVVQNTLLDFL
ncbi:MAG: flagellar hook-associated protein FlgL [Mobilitalea sp.]